MSSKQNRRKNSKLADLYNSLTTASRYFDPKSKQMSLEAFLTLAIQMNPNLTQATVHDYLKCKREFGDTNLFCSIQDYLAVTLLSSYDQKIPYLREKLLKWESFLPFRLLEQTKFLSLFREEILKRNAQRVRDFVVESLFELDTSSSFDVRSQTVWVFRRVDITSKLDNYLEIGLKSISIEQKEELKKMLRSISGDQMQVEIVGKLEDPKLRIFEKSTCLEHPRELWKNGLVDRFNVDFEIEARITTNKSLHEILSGKANLDSDFEFSVDIFGSDLPLEMAHISSAYLNFLLKTFYEKDVFSDVMSIFSEIKRIMLNLKTKRKFFNKFLTNSQTGIILPVHLFWMICLGFTGHSKLDLIFQLIDALRLTEFVDGLILIKTQMMDVEMEFKLQEPGEARKVLDILCRDYSLSSFLRGMDQTTEIRSSILENQSEINLSQIDLQKFESIKFESILEGIKPEEINKNFQNNTKKELVEIKKNLLSVLRKIREIREINQEEINKVNDLNNKMTINKRKKLESSIITLFFKLNQTFKKLFPSNPNLVSESHLSEVKIQSIKNEIIQELNEISSFINQSGLNVQLTHKSSKNSIPLNNTQSSFDNCQIEGRKINFNKYDKFGSFAKITNLKDPEDYFGKKIKENHLINENLNQKNRKYEKDPDEFVSLKKEIILNDSNKIKKEIRQQNVDTISNEIKSNSNIQKEKTEPIELNILQNISKTQDLINLKQENFKRKSSKKDELKIDLVSKKNIENSNESLKRTDTEIEKDGKENREYLISFGLPHKLASDQIIQQQLKHDEKFLDPYAFKITKINKLFAEVIRPTKEKKKFTMMAKLAKFLITKINNKKKNEYADDSIKSMHKENQSKSCEGSIYTVKTRKDGSRRLIANVKRSEDLADERLSVDVVSRFDQSETGGKESSRSLYNRFKYRESGLKLKDSEKTEDVYGIKTQLIKEVIHYPTNWKHSDDFSHFQPKTIVQVKNRKMRHSVDVMPSKFLLQVLPKDSEKILESIRFEKEVKQKLKNINKKEKLNDSKDIEYKKTNNKKIDIKLNSQISKEISNKESTNPIQIKNDSILDESKEIIISNPKNLYHFGFTKDEDQNVSLPLKPTLSNSHSKSLNKPIGNLSSSIKIPLSEKTKRQQLLKNSQISGYSNENGSSMSRIKQRVIIHERNFEELKPNISAKIENLNIYTNSGKNSDSIKVQSIYRQEKINNPPNVNSVQERPKKNQITYVRSYTLANTQGNSKNKKIPQFDSSNTFDNFDSYNLTSKGLFLI